MEPIPDNLQAKTSGYLDKKGKLKVMSSFKKYWFVLEGRLLLYYRSKDEYETLSPCKGSINLGPPCTVKPCTSNLGVFQIETRTNTVTLRANDIEDQNRWMQAIMSSLNQKQNCAPLSHFRYSLDNINSEDLERQTKTRKSLNVMSKRAQGGLIQKLQRMGAQSYGGSLGSICRLATSLHEKAERPQSACVENDEYSLIKRSPDGSVEFRRITPTPRENSLYEEHTYSVPQKNSPSPPPTHTSFILDNEHYCSVEKIVTYPNTDQEVIYTEPKYYDKTDHNENSVFKEKPERNLYEYLDYADYTEPKSFAEEKNANGVTSPSKRTFRSIFGLKERPAKEQTKLKKSQSFIKRVLKRRQRTPKEEDLYETVDDHDQEDKAELTDSNAVQMLTELQDILEHKKPLLMNQMVKTPSPTESRKSEEIIENDCYRGFDEERSDEDYPILPPKNHATYDIPKTLKPPPVQPKQKPQQTVDEILDDLDKIKVQNLIKQFSVGEAPEDTVVLRKHQNEDIPRHSDELTKLLDELAKVTNAPVLTPGVTNSLNSSNLTDDELLQFVPIRKRRLSEPDYDVPRPHRSLLSIDDGKSLKISDRSFFGPAQNADLEAVSMTPDSLEPEHFLMKLEQTSYTSHGYIIEGNGKELDRSIGRGVNIFKKTVEMLRDAEYKLEVIENPVMYKTMRTIEVEEDGDDRESAGSKVQDVFVDSLEICSEISTSF